MNGGRSRRWRRLLCWSKNNFANARTLRLQQESSMIGLRSIRALALASASRRTILCFDDWMNSTNCVSRKSFIGRALARNGEEPAVTERLFGTLGAEIAASLKGAHIIRTHDVRACSDALKLADIAAT